MPTNFPATRAHFFEEEIKKGIYRIVEFTTDENPSGYVIYRIEEAGGRELVVTGAYSANRVLDWSAYLMDLIERVARGLQCTSVRFHTSRPGLATKAINHGCHVSELILRKIL